MPLNPIFAIEKKKITHPTVVNVFFHIKPCRKYAIDKNTIIKTKLVKIIFITSRCNVYDKHLHKLNSGLRNHEGELHRCLVSFL